MNKRSVFVLTALLLIAVGPLFAADLVGTSWNAPQQGISMRLSGDGTYVFSGPGFTSQGQYVLNGQFLLMQDTNGNQAMYQLSQPQPTTLVLTDANGGQLQFEAPVGASSGIRLPGQTTPTSTPVTGGVLAESGGYRLTETEMQVGYDLIELVTDEKMTEMEKNRLRQAAVSEFTQAPQEFMNQINQLKNSMVQLHSITDPFQLGLARQMLFAQFYLATKNMPENQVPELIRLMKEHVHVVAEDPQNQLVLTTRDIQAMIEYNEFVAGLQGIQAEAIDPNLFASQIQAVYPTLPLETRQVLAAIYPVWQATRYSWDQLSDQQKNQVIMNMAQANTQQPQTWQQWDAQHPNQAPGPNSEWGQTSNGRMALEMMRSANNARIMSAMIDTTGGFQACLTCSPGINPYK